MSRFTAAYHVNGPSAQQLTDRQASTGILNTVNPTYTNDFGLSANASNNYNPFGHSHDLPFSGLLPLAALSETPTRMQNRTTTSVLGYNQTNREHSRHRASRWLVLVLPPAFITQSQAVFGHTLASGPSSRLSQGLLMPLYPTMYAQLGAIAREFNFPNIIGISLYMHVNEAGTLFTPRISEESWGILWGHLFEPNAPSPNSGLPISGRIEFDIDVAKARWFDSWASTSRRETASLGSLSPTHVASMHQQQESKTTVNFEDVQERSQAAVGTKNGIGYTPKRLSLVERFDSNNSSPPMPLPIMEPVPVIAPVPMPKPHPATPPAKKPVLSTAVQEEPTLSHKEDIDNRVKSWRASATFKKTLLASTGQVSLDPANMPNTVLLDDPVNEVDEVRMEINPKDYSWSITSAGPPSVLDSPISTSSYQPSVHMDRRATGSVPLTPETCTSWGPEDYDPHSPILSEFRLPSPDLGQRNLEHCPMTPTTATSWGPPSEYPPSPDPESQWARAPSLDLGQRAGWSRPVTPSTATSWGPPSEYPPSPQLESQWAYCRPPSVDLGRRAEGSRPATPSTATSWGPPEEWPPTPTTLSRVSTPDPAQQSFSFAEEVGGLAPRSKTIIPESSGPWNFVWPYLTLGELSPKSPGPGPGRSQVAPLSDPTECRRPTVVVERVAYPVIKIYPAVYPHFDIYPSVRDNCADPNGAPRDLSGTVTIRTQRRIPPEPMSVSNSGSLEAGRTGYPSLSIYPAVYPYFVIYPKVQAVEIKCSDRGQGSKPYLPSCPNDLKTQPWSIGPHSSRPDFSPVPISSSVPTRETLSPVLRSGMAYPVFNIYPAVYPFFDVYPTVERYAVSQPSKAVPQTVPSVTSKAITGTKLGYPVMKIYNAVYPHFDIYPRVAYHVHKPESHKSRRRFPDVPKTTVSVRLQAVYPALDIYPTVYPYLNIYPAVTGVSKPVHPTPVPSASNIVKRTDVHSKLGYPSLVIYPSVYPWIDVYPSVAGGITRPPSQTTVRQPRIRLATHPRTKLRKRFTADENAPPVPKLPDYVTLRALSQSFPPPPQHGRMLSLQEPFAYPVISIYPPVYPYFDIYPAVAGGSSPRQPREEQRLSSGKFRVAPASVKLEAAYPQFDIYPAVYPNFDIYPTIKGAVMKTKTKIVAPPVQASNTPSPPYPVIQIYKPVYPYFDIYPSWFGTQGNPQHKNHGGALHHKLSLRSTESPKRTPPEPVGPSGPAYPIIRIYNPVYPHFDIYPSWVRAQTVPVVKRVFETRKSRRELHEEVLTTSIKFGEFASQPKNAPTLRYPPYPAYPTFEIYKAAYPHFNVYPSYPRVLAPPVEDVSRLKRTPKCHKELHNEVALGIPTAIPGDRGVPVATDRVSLQPHELTIVTKQRELVDDPEPLPSVPTVPPLRLRRRFPSLDQLNGQDSSPPRPRVSPVFDGFPSIETRLSQLKGEMMEVSGPTPTALKRTQSLYTQPTPRRRQSALILQRIKALNAAAESPEPVLDRPLRRSTRSLPITPTRA